LFDVRPGEYLRTLFMFLYLLFVMFGYYILKPVSRAMFLNQFEIEQLPFLILAVAIFSGVLAYLYTRLAVRTSLGAAVLWTTVVSVACLLAMWWLLGFHLPWMLYVLNVWVSLFSIVLVSQGWLVASNLFTAREAKRLYALLGMGMVIGAAFGGEFTRRTAVLVGTHNLLLASALMVILAYLAFRLAAAQQRPLPKQARAASDDDQNFAFSRVLRDIFIHRHLQVIIGIMLMMYIVDVLVDYQFQAMAQSQYKGDHLTAFLGTFYGLYLNTADFVFQFFLTTLVVSWFGVGGSLEVLPGLVLVTSLGTVAAPGLISTSVVRLAEAATRYTVNRTGLELLYMPIPQQLRNRIKAFLDISFDRMSRGMGGLLLILLTSVLSLTVREIAAITMALTLPWLALVWWARKEYVSTVRKRFESRRLELDELRLPTNDPGTIALIEQALQGGPRQACYALGLLAGVRGYNLAPRFTELARSPFPEVRAKVFELARETRIEGLSGAANGEVQNAGTNGPPVALKPAIAYAIAMAADPAALARELLTDGRYAVSEAVLEALADSQNLAADVVTAEWIAEMARSPEPERRTLAAMGIGVSGDRSTVALYPLLVDSEPAVVSAACRSAGALRDRSYIYAMIQHLPNARLRRVVIESLVSFGYQICGMMGDFLLDEAMPAGIRRQVPRVLKRIPHQRSVDALLPAIGHRDLGIRAAALKALNSLRETAPDLHFDAVLITRHILTEARYYFELHAALDQFRSHRNGPRAAASLLARTLEERLRQTLERLFRLLGLRYPPLEIYSAYRAVAHSRSEQAGAALEFLENILERDLKRILLPLLDAPERVLDHGRELFGVEAMDAEAAVRELIRSNDPWLVTCAMSAAAELGFRNLAPEIAKAAEKGEAEVCEVARSVRLALA